MSEHGIDTKRIEFCKKVLKWKTPKSGKALLRLIKRSYKDTTWQFQQSWDTNHLKKSEFSLVEDGNDNDYFFSSSMTGLMKSFRGWAKNEIDKLLGRCPVCTHRYLKKKKS